MKFISILTLFLVVSFSAFCPRVFGKEEPENQEDIDNAQLTSLADKKKQAAEKKEEAEIEITSKTTFNAWSQAIHKLPKGLETGKMSRKTYSINYENVATVSELNEKEFRRVLEAYPAWLKQSSHADSNTWLNGKAQTWIKRGEVYLEDKQVVENYYNLQANVERDHYVQKLQVTGKNTVVVHGDLHGDVHSLVTSLQDYVDGEHGFKLKDPNTYILFLGDYVDKGLYGFECLYMLLRLKSENPNQIFFVRGNHESKSSNDDFLAELHAKQISDEIYELICAWYTMLPVSLYIGYNENYMQCTHGGWEKSYNPKEFLNSNYQFQKVILPSKSRTTLNGFMWNNFFVESNIPFSIPSNKPGNNGVILRLSKSDTYKHLKEASEGSSKLMGILRAHQHGDKKIMDIILNRILFDVPDGEQLNEDNIGIAKLWTDQSKTGTKLWFGIVVTFNVCPHTVHGVKNEFDFDSYGVLRVADLFDDWSLMVHRKTTVNRSKVKIVEH
jgi:hypothetical protein